MKLMTVLLSGALMAGCAAVGPDYAGPPAVDTGAGWAQSVVPGPVVAELSDWWLTFGDPVLGGLVTQALAKGPDVRAAQARILEARAWRDRAAGGQMPVLEAGASVTRRGQSENGPQPVGLVPRLERNQTIHEVGFDALWEVDLFGRTRRSVEGAQAQLQAARADARGVALSVAGEVARNYFVLRGAQREQVAREASVETLRQTLTLVERQHQAGEAARSDVDAVRARLESASAALPGIQARARSAALALGVLQGKLPEDGLVLLDTNGPEISLKPLPVGERADILRRRPDVQAAERRLAARVAEVGVATAELFPKLTIGAGVGFQSLESGSLFQSASRTFSLMPLISWRVFDGGRVRAEIHASQAREQQAALAYEQAVLAALGDAERALGNYQSGLVTLTRQQAALQAARSRYTHMQARYGAGDVALMDLLTEERLVRDAEDALARGKAAAAIDLVALFKALGGGWSAWNAQPHPAQDQGLQPQSVRSFQ